MKLSIQKEKDIKDELEKDNVGSGGGPGVKDYSLFLLAMHFLSIRC